MINNEYKYMAFTYTSGANNTPYTITFSENTECDILIVAGGGAGGHREDVSSNGGAGGGAGGLILRQNLILSGSKTLNVGRGGIANSLRQRGENGIDSSFDTTIVIGGGGGGTRAYVSSNDPTGIPSIGKGGNGGSGGGSQYIDANGTTYFDGGSGRV